MINYEKVAAPEYFQDEKRVEVKLKLLLKGVKNERTFSLDVVPRICVECGVNN